MLTKMKQTIDFVMSSRANIFDENVMATIFISAAHNIENDYALLIPNEKNVTDVKNMLNIDGAQAILEFSPNPINFGINAILSTHSKTEDVINYFKQNSIIMSNDGKMEEYIEFARIAEELSYSNFDQYFAVRNLAFFPRHNGSGHERQINDFWHKRTRDDNARISSIRFEKGIASLFVECDVKLPASISDAKEVLPPKRVLNQLSYDLMSELRKNHILKDCKPKVKNCVITIPSRTNVVFGMREHSSWLYDYAGNKHIQVSVTSLNHGEVRWGFRAEIPHMEFMERIAKYYKEKIAD